MKSFEKFYGRYHDLIKKYQRSVKIMVNDSFPGLSLFDIWQDFSRFRYFRGFVTWICRYFDCLVSQPSKCLKFMTFWEGCFVIRN